MTTSSSPLRILVAYGSKREGTAEIARTVAGALRDQGFAVDCLSADLVRDASTYDAFIVGGAVYMNRWHRDARRFVSRFGETLRARPTWFFSSGPLDATATTRVIPPVRGVVRMIERVGARGHVTFGGRLASDARGFPASAMARTHAGDWRDWDQIDAWANEVAGELAKLPRLERTPVHAPARWVLATLCFVVGVTAVFGGLALAIRPDGSLLQMPLVYLDHTPFPDFRIPGLLLLAFVGIGNLIAGGLVIRRSEHADLVALGAGSTLSIWITAQMLLLRTMNGLQIGSLVVGTLIIAESIRRLSYSLPFQRSVTR